MVFSLVPKQLTQSPDGMLWTASSALSTVEASNKVWNRVNAALVGASPSAQAAFKGLKLWLATQKGNPNLRFSFLTGDAAALVSSTGGGLVTASTGQIVGSGVTTVYGIYLKAKVGATAPTYTIFLDEGTDAAISGLTASITLTLANLAASTASVPSENVYISPKGDPYLLGLRASAVTAPQGLTIDAAADSVDGFVISA